MAQASLLWSSKAVLKAESQLISVVQNVLDEDNSFLLWFSKVCDTSYATGILFPVFASLDTKLGFQVLLVTSFTEWVCTILKWILAEGRPYWWVHEANVNVHLRHSELTCETGPGSPSGHVMGTAALGYVFLHWLSIWFNNNISSECPNLKEFLKVSLLAIYFSIVFLISVTRINLAAHFPHQCLLGAILGYFLAKFLVGDGKWTFTKKIQKMSKLNMSFLALFLSILSACFYGAHHLLGFDPGWSIKLAFKWCRRPDKISVYTTPIYSLVRDSGCFFGMALASPIKERKFYPIVGATVTTLFFVSTRLIRPLMPSNDPFQFYLFHFLDNLFIGLSLLTIIPYIASLVKLKEKCN